ncbi:MAG: glycoside hydrolase family 81 [Armatimonadetes bacterium]|nr:glycoside hydrolase family 81 [Armatimonadota bacterium]
MSTCCRLFVLLALARLVGAEVVPVGAGGYLTTPPAPCKPIAAVPFRTADVAGPMATGQWWSSLVWQTYSQPMFAHPLVLRCTEGGVTLSYPGDRIHGDKVGIFGGGAGPNGDLRIGHSTAPSFPRADCGGYSDWFVTAAMSNGPAGLRVSFGHGSPYVFVRTVGGDAALTLGGKATIWSGTANGATLGITVNGHHYGLFGPVGSTWTGLDGPALICAAKGRDYLTVALLPDARPETLALFTKTAHNHVTDTRVSWSVAGGRITATYAYTTRPLEGSGVGTLFALYPHQWKTMSSPLTELTYGSVRGTMKVGAGTSFVTTTPVQGLLPRLPDQGIVDRERTLALLRAEAERKAPGFGDTYWEGKHLGRLATLSGVAEAAGATDLQAAFQAELRRRLEAWFTATEGKDQPVFYYNAVWGSLIGSRPSYGSDMPLNDHHFHYGYFIRAAAEVARHDAAWATKWGPMVKLLIRDIASPDRRDPLFPFLRCFDKYAGHSWASGDANFGDGNNQESSSESLNAWYGTALWGEATGDAALRDAGLYLFNTERTAVEQYWFDVDGTNYPKDYPNVALGMVWGGKGAFGTWFSGDIDCIHGINWLPFTPASLYMGRHPDYVARNHARIVEVRERHGDYNNGWGDLVAMFGALAEPAPAVAYLKATPDPKLEGGNSLAFMDHWVHTLDRLGHVDAGVTADHWLNTVFVKDGRRTYVAYNGQATPRAVSFSDGTRLPVPARALSVKQNP